MEGRTSTVQKRTFPQRISAVNVTKSAVSSLRRANSIFALARKTSNDFTRNTKNMKKIMGTKKKKRKGNIHLTVFTNRGLLYRFDLVKDFVKQFP